MVRFSTPAFTSYEADCRAGGAVSPVPAYVMVRRRSSVLRLPQLSTRLSPNTKAERGGLRFSKSDRSVPFRAIATRTVGAAYAAERNCREALWLVTSIATGVITGSLNVTFKVLDVASYTADCIAGDVVSVYDMARVRLASFALPHMSVMPPGSMVALRGWPRFSNAALCAAFSVALREPCSGCVKLLAGSVRLPDKEPYSMIFAES